MYIIAIIGIVAATIFLQLTMAGQVYNMLPWFFDMPNILLLLLITIPILCSNGLWKDFCNAFRFTLSKKTAKSLYELKRALEALKLFMKSMLYGSIFLTMGEAVIILYKLEDLAQLGPNVSLMALLILYAMAVNTILLPLESRLKIQILEYLNINKETETED